MSKDTKQQKQGNKQSGPPRVDEVQQRRTKIQELREAGVDPYGGRFNRTHTISEAIEAFAQAEKALPEEERAEFALTNVRLAGRVMAKRGKGKVCFGDLKDRSGRMQFYCKRDDIGQDVYQHIKKRLYVGDFLGVEGEVFRTKAGEVTIRLKGYQFLGKALRPLPEKHKGLRDVEKRYRHRSVDLVMNDDARDVFIKRFRMMSIIRRFFEERGFFEVEGPVLHPIAGGAAARPFVTHHNALGMDLYLRIALELHLKRLIVGGLEKVFEIGRVFRNEGVSVRHNPEFTMLEAYWAYADYEDMMQLTEDMISRLARELNGTMALSWDGQDIDLTPPWKRASSGDLLKEHGGVDLDACTTLEETRKIAKEKGIEVAPSDSQGRILDNMFAHFCDPHLIGPIIVKDYPISLSPLAKQIPDKPHLTYRFEAFIGGMEICNAFSELNDAEDQRRRFERQADEKAAGDDEACDVDEDYLFALEHGMPSCGGIGFGLGRLMMLLAGVPSIRDVILFPHMRHKHGEDEPEEEGAEE